MNLSNLYNALALGLIHAPMAIGVFLSLRIMKKPDLTVEGSFSLGAIVSMQLLYNDVHFSIAILAALVCGAIAGLVTSIIHTKMKIDVIISGLLVSLAMFSINMFILSGSNTISAPRERYIFWPIREWFVGQGVRAFTANFWASIVVGAIVVAITLLFLHFLFKTSFGLSVRATGDNERMACSQGIDTDSRKIFALVVSNGLIGMSGALTTQMFMGANLESGVGAFVIGIAAIVMGEILTPKRAGLFVKLMLTALGAVIFFGLRVGVISLGIPTAWERGIAALVVLVVMCVPRFREMIFGKRGGVR
ncbi:MAG: hypothetical protein FWB93_00670 [Oscillospiraceae bacterium]|nr:hypothetical protein [Oscillospiraceae bacterium]